MGRTLLAHLVIIQALGVSVVAWAGSDRRESFATARLDARDLSKVIVRGELKCLLPEENTGQACSLSLASDDGQAFRIAQSNQAMRLYHDGKTQVVATGTIIGNRLQLIAIRSE